MPTLVGLHGHSGAGKSTAARHLAATCGGEMIYLGGIILDEVRARNLDRSPENELKVRFELRETYGQDFLLAHAEAKIRAVLRSGRDVFVDAVLSHAEWERLRTFGAQCTLLLSIFAPFEARAERLARRLDRPFDRKDLIDRDEAEERRLKTGHLDVSSMQVIVNDGTEASFLRQLEEFAFDLHSNDGVSSRDQHSSGRE